MRAVSCLCGNPDLQPLANGFKSAKTATLTTFKINTCKSVSKQITLTTFRINTYEKQGGGGYLAAIRIQGKRGANSLLFPRYLWPACVMRAMMSRRLSATEEPMYSARSAAVHLLIVALMAAAHLSIPSALG